MKKILLIVDHVNKSKDTILVFEQVINLLRQKAKFGIVLGTHMKLTKFSVKSTITETAKQSINKIINIPYFLFKRTVEADSKK